jgi:hypothetical protein
VLGACSGPCGAVLAVFSFCSIKRKVKFVFLPLQPRKNPACLRKMEGAETFSSTFCAL